MTIDFLNEGKWAQLAAPQSQNWDGKEVVLF